MMKRILTIIMIAALAAISYTQAANEGKAGIKFPESTWDFGNIKEKGGPVSHEFEFYNDGTGNLVILDATAQCGCTKPEFSEKPVAPGKKGKIKVTYNPIGRPGSFEKTVTVRTNGKPKKAYLKIRGNVVPAK